jgi:hypothetical protein
MNRRNFLTSSAASLATASLIKSMSLGQAVKDHPITNSAGSKLPYRQVHLDFHTSELITDVGKDFKAEEFAATLKAAHVNSINLFAKCHHGWAYYDTKVAHRHPHLKIDLLSEQLNAVRGAGIAGELLLFACLGQPFCAGNA